MKNGGATFLDLGCAFAQDLRRLVADGVDSRQCYGSDLRLDLIDLGYDLFRDRDNLQSEFIEADIFDSKSPLSRLHGKIDIINASSFFHLFTRDEQLQIARECVKLMRPQANSLLVGRHRAQVIGGHTTGKFGPSPKYWHSPDSWKEFWAEIGEELDVKFDVDVVMTGARFEALESPPQPGQEVSMSFTVRRL
jgi:SAM-dependent methyltransferase